MLSARKVTGSVACEFYFLILLEIERSSLISYLDLQSVKDSPIAQFLVWLVITNPNMTDLNLINDERKKNLSHASFEENRKIGSEIFREKDWDANNSLQDITFFKDSMGLRIGFDFLNIGRLLVLPPNPIVVINKEGKVFT